MRARGQNRVQFRDAGLHVSGHRCRLSLAVLDVEPLAFPLISGRSSYGGTPGLLEFPGLLRLPSLGLSAFLLLKALPVRTLTL
jgi:hypothetical protein